MNKYFYILLLIVLVISCRKEVENFKPTTKLTSILKDKKLEKTYYDFRLKSVYLTSRIATTESFKKFVNETNFEELVFLTECEKPIVRCFAFKALVEKDYPKIREILLAHKYDEEIITEYSGCIVWNITVKEYMLRQLEPFAKTKYRFNRKEFEDIQKDFTAK